MHLRSCTHGIPFTDYSVVPTHGHHKVGSHGFRWRNPRISVGLGCHGIPRDSVNNSVYEHDGTPWSRNNTSESVVGSLTESVMLGRMESVKGTTDLRGQGNQ